MNSIYSLQQNLEKKSCKPFIKWAGGKGRILDMLVELLPQKFNNYFEPFVGGGALYFATLPASSNLSDINNELINTYVVIQKHVEELIVDLKKHLHTEEYYYNIRNLDRTEQFQKLSGVERASRFVFLNKTCFNGMYRVNQKKNYFNVPYGHYKTPNICNEQVLRSCSIALQNTTIACQSFLRVIEVAQEDDFIYFDPPYAEKFTGYTKECFENNMQIELRKLCDKLTSNGVHWMLSNSDVEFIRNEYCNYKIKIIQNNSTIGGKGSERKKINESVITNY